MSTNLNFTNWFVKKLNVQPYLLELLQVNPRKYVNSLNTIKELILFCIKNFSMSIWSLVIKTLPFLALFKINMMNCMWRTSILRCL